jgi:hypothetical protein
MYKLFGDIPIDTIPLDNFPFNYTPEKNYF